MLQINPFLDCTVYSRIVVHIAQNSHKNQAFKEHMLLTSRLLIIIKDQLSRNAFHSSGSYICSETRLKFSGTLVN
jgi:hypothetical protein